jgi:hypothetical protein
MGSRDENELRLQPGDRVTVRSQAEILATLDEDSALDGLPFMPEMLQFCGRRFCVSARADRTVVEKLGIRRMRDTVHLGDLRCDGMAHDSCCRMCLLFWKEAWLARVPATPPVTAVPPRPLRTRSGDGYYCQASHLDRATLPRPPVHFGQELGAVAAEGLSPITLAHSLAILAYDVISGRLGGKEWNTLPGPCGKTPSVSLGLQPGERVRVKAAPAIFATLNARGHNRGMEFSREMLAYCGRELTVLRRLERLIRDQSTRLVPVHDTVILAGAVYRALNRRAVPRREYMFWRECWLERV